MNRSFYTLVLIVAVLSAVRYIGAFSGTADGIIAAVVSVAWTIAFPLFLLSVFFAPGLFREITDPVDRVWHRLVVRRRDVEELRRKVAHLNKAHHMVQLGAIYQQQGRHAAAAEWFERALDREPDLLDARYRLALCRFGVGEYGRAAPLLESVHAEKPGHDYGVAYLRLAQTHHRMGNAERADEVYQTLLRFYPGHPEGTFHHATLLAERGDVRRARLLMREVIFTVRHSPGFQRRRTRHWMVKAYWWLWRHRGTR